jgi:peptidoglycan/LPS O-acetylase OafA/YrhL
LYTVKRQNEIDLLRIIAALAVFFYHYIESFNYFNRIVPGNLIFGSIFRYAYMGVPLFFVISGYVVTMTAMNKTIGEFVKSRIVRLYPAFWFSLLLCYAVPRMFPVGLNYMPYSGVRLLMYNLTMVPAVFGKSAINPVSWTLLEEMHFYFLIALFIIFKLWNKLFTVISCWLIIFVIILETGHIVADSSVGLLVPKHSLYFISGILFYLVRINYGTPWKLYTLLACTFIPLIGVSFAFASFTNVYIYKQPHAVSVYVYIAINLAIYITFWLIAKRKLSITNSKLLKLGGDLTYPFYLVHVLGLSLYWYWRNTFQPQLLLLIMILICGFVSYLINRFIEKPSGKLLKKWLDSIEVKKLPVIAKLFGQ